MVNFILIVVVLIVIGLIVRYVIVKNKNAEVVEDIAVEDKTFTVDAVMIFIKKRTGYLFDIRFILELCFVIALCYA